MTQIQVRLGPSRFRSYPIEIRPGLFSLLPRLLAQLAGNAPAFIITDTRVRNLYGRRLHRQLEAAGTRAVLLVVPGGERSKNARIAYRLQSRLLEGKVRRDSVVVALGGGVVGDLAGYVAATVLRGVRLVQVPTTLLSQVDSSVGGKVGIDHPAGKNMIGAFYQPEAVYIDPLLLRTLPAAEFRNGLAEMVKIAAALDRELFGLIERYAPRLSRTATRMLTELITRSVGLKAAVVEQDEREEGVRKALNLGHTIGHALEASTGFRLKHGKAVAIGMAAEARIAESLGLLSRADRERLIRLLSQLRLPHVFPRLNGGRLYADAMARDKKSDAGGVKFVLLRRIGRCAIGVSVPDTVVQKIAGRDTINRREHGR